MEYRIKELDNRFTVQVFIPERSLARYFPILPTKVIPEHWALVSMSGLIYSDRGELPSPEIAQFNTFTKAKEFINELINPPKPKYHYNKESDFDFLESPEYIKKKNEAASNDLKKHKKNENQLSKELEEIKKRYFKALGYINIKDLTIKEITQYLKYNVH